MRGLLIKYLTSFKLNRGKKKVIPLQEYNYPLDYKQ